MSDWVDAADEVKKNGGGRQRDDGDRRQNMMERPREADDFVVDDERGRGGGGGDVFDDDDDAFEWAILGRLDGDGPLGVFDIGVYEDDFDFDLVYHIFLLTNAKREYGAIHVSCWPSQVKWICPRLAHKAIKWCIVF